jgi:transformation/transcription domain-associated protein
MQAIYYLLRTYLLEPHNIAQKPQLGREAVAAQHQVQWMPASVASSASLNSVEINPIASHPSARNLTSKAVNNQLPWGGSLTVPRNGSNPQGQESDRTQTIHGNIPAGLESSQRNFAGMEATALMAFDHADDIMKALKNKHSNLASEIEVCFLLTILPAYFDSI